MHRRIGRTFVGLPLLLALLLAAGCDGGEDRPQVDVVGTSGSESASGSVSGSASGSVSASGAVEPGVVEPKPADAAQVDVTLREWAIELAQTSVRAGKLYFLAENAGPEDPHELVIIRTDLAADALPVEDHKVPEGEVDIITEIEPFASQSKASTTVELPKGSYVLICNITEVEGGETESHYEEGMRVAFNVQ
jgi:hypothetical protein